MLFKDVIGQNRMKQLLIRNVGQRRIGHAQLFLGNEDTGALPLAIAFARFIQCRNRGTDDACGQCTSCIKFDKLAHPDLHFFFPSAPNQEHKKDVSSKLFMHNWRELLLENPYFTYARWLQKLGIENKQAIINAEDCNDIIRALGMKSYESPYRVVVIYMPEKLYHAAAPKLLKVLEEPPENTLFLMVSENKERILNTILSRTQIQKLSLPDEDDVYHALTERYGTEPARAKQIAFLSGGRVSEALMLSQHDEEQLADFVSFREWMRYCYQNDVSKILKWVEQVMRDGREKQKSFFQYGLKIFRLCLLQNYQLAQLIRLEGEEQEFIQRFSKVVNHRNTLQIVEAFNEAILHLERNANPRILFTDLSLQMHKMMQAGSR